MGVGADLLEYFVFLNREQLLFSFSSFSFIFFPSWQLSVVWPLKVSHSQFSAYRSFEACLCINFTQARKVFEFVKTPKTHDCILL